MGYPGSSSCCSDAMGTRRKHPLGSKGYLSGTFNGHVFPSAFPESLYNPGSMPQPQFIRVQGSKHTAETLCAQILISEWQSTCRTPPCSENYAPESLSSSWPYSCLLRELSCLARMSMCLFIFFQIPNSSMLTNSMLKKIIKSPKWPLMFPLLLHAPFLSHSVEIAARLHTDINKGKIFQS